jgi:BlaI family transcriptional regulator, penicillinase repressor
MPRMIGKGLSRREREILEVLYRQGQATAAEVQAALPDPPTYSAVRSILRILVEKGYARHEEQGKRYLYLPTQPHQSAARSALRQVLQTFFGGSLESAVRTFLTDETSKVDEEELARLAELIEEAQSQEGEAE